MKKGVLTGPDPDDRIVHEMLRKDYSRMTKKDRERYDRAEAEIKKSTHKTPNKK